MVKRVCVIGVGAAGLASLRYLTENPDLFDVIAFEQTTEVGGLWVYKENNGTDEHGRRVHSAMYPDLVTNFPTSLMEFPGFPYPENLPCFVHNAVVRKYFEDFCDQLSLRKYIQFATRVIEVKPFAEEGNDSHKWEVTVESMATGKDEAAKQKTYFFDAVMVCNGRFFEPNLPTLPGVELFTGDVRHSHFYRRPEEYTGKTVAILSGGLVSTDIAYALIPHAKHIYQCRSEDHGKFWPLLKDDKITNCTGIKEVKANSIILEGGSQIEVDALILGTGYKFSFPFLAPECHLKIEDERITPLYKHVVHAEFPSMGFISVTSFLPLIDMQARFFVASLTGHMTVPSREEMERDIDEDYQRALSSGIAKRHYHLVLPPRVGFYIQDVATTGKIFPVPPFYEKLLVHLIEHWFEANFLRNIIYKRIGDENFTATNETEGLNFDERK